MSKLNYFALLVNELSFFIKKNCLDLVLLEYLICFSLVFRSERSF